MLDYDRQHTHIHTYIKLRMDSKSVWKWIAHRFYSIILEYKQYRERNQLKEEREERYTTVLVIITGLDIQVLIN